MKDEHLRIMRSLFGLNNLRQHAERFDKSPPQLALGYIRDNSEFSDIPLLQPVIFDKVEFDYIEKLRAKQECSDLYPDRDVSKGQKNSLSNNSRNPFSDSNSAPTIRVIAKLINATKHTNYFINLNVNDIIIADEIYSNPFGISDVKKHAAKTAEDIKGLLAKCGCVNFIYQGITEFKKAMKDINGLVKAHKFMSMESVMTMENVTVGPDAIFSIELYNLDFIYPILKPQSVDGLFLNVRVVDPRSNHNIIDVSMTFSNFRDNVYVVDGNKTQGAPNKFDLGYLTNPLKTIKVATKKESKQLIEDSKPRTMILPNHIANNMSFPSGCNITSRADSMLEITLPPGVTEFDLSSNNLNNQNIVSRGKPSALRPEGSATLKVDTPRTGRIYKKKARSKKSSRMTVGDTVDVMVGGAGVGKSTLVEALNENHNKVVYNTDGEKAEGVGFDYGDVIKKAKKPIRKTIADSKNAKKSMDYASITEDTDLNF